jgi:hypothetical protein
MAAGYPDRLTRLIYLSRRRGKRVWPLVKQATNGHFFHAIPPLSSRRYAEKQFLIVQAVQTAPRQLWVTGAAHEYFSSARNPGEPGRSDYNGSRTTLAINDRGISR